MRTDTEVRAYEALSLHDRAHDLATLTYEAMQGALTGGAHAAASPKEAYVVGRAAELGLTRDAAATAYGNALDVLERGPTDEAERALARALAAHALAANRPAEREAEDRTAADLLRLALHTPFDATGLLDRALADAAPSMWDAIADRMRRIDDGSLPGGDRAEALMAAIALASSPSPTAAKLASALAAAVRDDKVAYVLARGADGASGAWVGPLAGEMAPRPRGSIASTLLGLSGISLVLHAARLVGRFAFAYRRPAELTLSEDGGVRLHWRVELLGRTLRDRDVVVPKSGLVRAMREVRYPGLTLYAALLALVVGTYVGVSAFVDGVRASSPSLLGTGLLLVVLGLGLDFVLSSVLPGARGQCRILLTPRNGAPLCLGGVDVGAADAILKKLVGRV